ncbi:hypothetical protein Goshw_011353, partial [Gossypium schwendimanii]|nr:hypothetical protein [Gossypium schwendimanii]
MQELENREHIFRDCSITKEIWEKVNYAWPHDISHMEFMDWFTWIMINSRVDVCRTIVCAIWAIWTAKNQWIHEGHKRSRAETVKFIIQYLQDLKDINQKHLALSPEVVIWRPLEQGFYKINFNAAAVIMGRDLGLKHVEIEGDSLT